MAWNRTVTVAAPTASRAALAASERRPGETVQAAIHRLEDERQRLYRDRPHDWQARLATLNSALSGLWEQKRAIQAERHA